MRDFVELQCCRAESVRVYIVMPFIEHDLKTLLADMPHPFLQSEVKTIMLQLLSAVAHCHANWIVCPYYLPLELC